MSLASQITQNCPHCNTGQVLAYYQSVNVTLEPELKAKVLSGKLNVNICKNCGEEINIVSGFLYHDMSNKIMLELCVTENESDDAKKEMIATMINDGYIYRSVSEYGRIVEKINIFDNNLNDHIIQQIADEMKAILESSFKEVVGKESDFTVVFNKIEKGFFKEKISFYCFSNPGQMMEMKYETKKLAPASKKLLFNIDALRN